MPLFMTAVAARSCKLDRQDMIWSSTNSAARGTELGVAVSATFSGLSNSLARINPSSTGIVGTSTESLADWVRDAQLATRSRGRRSTTSGALLDGVRECLIIGMFEKGNLAALVKRLLCSLTFGRTLHRGESTKRSVSEGRRHEADRSTESCSMDAVRRSDADLG